MSSTLLTSTYSMWSAFRNCRKACEYRYQFGLVPREKDPNLSFGSLIHECLQIWHGTGDITAVLAFIDRACAARVSDQGVRRDWHLAKAMMTGYASRYPHEEFTVMALEKNFEGPIVNPETGAASRSFVLAGKVDGIVRIGGDHYILEHKTAATIDADYLERLWTDFQIAIYSFYVEQALGIPITGVIYNVLGKARLQQSQGETEEEYHARRAELLEKSKTGKTTAKRKLPESDEEFQARLSAKYLDPEMFHREMLYLSRDRFDVLRAELWELTQAFLDARRRKVFYQNTTFCFHHNRPCAYFPICRSNGNPNVIENFYTIAGWGLLRGGIGADGCRGAQDPPTAYYRLFRLITRGSPASMGVPMLNATVHGACQGTSGLPATMRPVSLLQQGGSLFQQSAGGLTFDRVGGGAPSAAAPTVINITVPGAKEFFEKETVRVVVENPRAVQSAAMAATKQNAGRREMTGLQLSPGLIVS